MKKKMSYMQIIALGYLLIIALGTALLMLPFSSAAEGGASLRTCLFTATSASCVTGLVLCDTATSWTGFGQAVILCMIQIGGLGFMTFATLFYILIRRKMGLRERSVMVESINTTQIGGIMGLTRKIALGTLIFEGTGAVLLCIRFIPRMGAGKGIWCAVFHSVSAFCNAGFDLLGAYDGPFSSFCSYSGDWLVNVVLIALITIGGLGFLVWDDLSKKKLRVRRYTLQTKLVLSVSAILTLGGAALFFLLEKGLPFGERLLTSLFSSVTARTAGFNTIDTAALSPGSRLLTMMLMFIGGSPGSTAGGVKTTTMAVLLIYTFAGIRREQSAGIFGRSIDTDTFKKSASVFFFNLLLALFGALAVCAIQPLHLEDVLFECFSAIGTVGMTTGITRALLPASSYIIAFLMFCGRVGSISFAVALLEKRARPPVLRPVEQITVG